MTSIAENGETANIEITEVFGLNALDALHRLINFIQDRYDALYCLAHPAALFARTHTEQTSSSTIWPLTAPTQYCKKR